jgi:hypothetical protein
MTLVRHAIPPNDEHEQTGNGGYRLRALQRQRRLSRDENQALQKV